MKLVALAVASCFASAAFANPDGPATAFGSVNLNGLGTSALTVTNTGGTSAIINWNGFSIPAGEVTRFQNFVNLSVLNRVTGPDMSRILGELHSDGRLFLINQNGILLGAGALVDVPGLVASTLNMSDDHFKAGHMLFTDGAGAGPLDNQANITVPGGGQVYLIGNAVTNGGVITSPNGDVVLAAGNSVELVDTGMPGLSVSIDAPGNEALNMNRIVADSGRVGIFAGVVNQGGVINANGAFLGPDGSILLRATNATTFAANSSTTAANLEIDTGSLTVAGDVNTGSQSIHATNGLVVQNAPGGFAQLTAQVGQSIEAGFVEVNAAAGGSASISSFGGDQRITTNAANASGEGLAVRNFGGLFAGIQANSGGQHINVQNADRAVIEGALGNASLGNFEGVQTIALTGAGANALVLGSPGALAQSVIGGGGFQTVVAGNPGEQGSITIYGTATGGPANAFIVSNPVFGGTQTVSTPGALDVLGGSAPGGSAAGVFANGIDGQQTVTAGSIVLQGGAAGSDNSAMIGANNGSQSVSAGPGGITLLGGANGFRNFAMINQASTSPLAMQALTSAGPVLLQGGEDNFDFAMIRAFGGHQELTFGDTTLLAGAGGIDNFSVIQGRNQDVTVHGDLAIIGRGSETGSAGGGARIGGLGGGAPSATSLRLNVDHDFTMVGGSVTGTLLGNTAGFTGNTDISVHAGRNVTLSGGTGPDTFSSIGSRASNPAGGAIDITAGGEIALNSTAPDKASGIRTTDGVTLTAQQITQGPDAFIEAGSLSVQTASGASLEGANAVDIFNASNWLSGDVTFNNASPLLTVTGVINPIGGVSLRQAGDMRVSGSVASGLQAVDVTGGLVVQNDPFSFAQLGAQGGQTIHAGYVEVNGVLGGSAGIFNFDGPQHIATTSANAAGEGLAIRATDGSFAGIDSPTGPQTIDVRDADRVVVNGLSGFANLTSFGGPQRITVSGTGANELLVGGLASTHQSMVGANEQTIVAGASGEQGSISVFGTAASGFGNAFIMAGQFGDGAQALSTSGALRVFGGTAPGNFPAGVFSNGPGGQQRIVADSILLRGGAGGGGNGATISAGGLQSIEAGTGGITLIGGDSGSGNSAIIGTAGSQMIEAGAGGITLLGGANGGGNFALINQVSTDPAAAQTVLSAGPVLLRGGADGTLNFAMIRTFGGQQELTTGDLTLHGGAGGTNNFATIQGGQQSVRVFGNVVVASHGSTGTETIGGGARIGGLGGAVPSPTHLALDVSGDLTMTAGDVQGTGVSLGGNIVDGLPSIIVANVGGNVALAGGTAPDTIARIGSANSGVTAGDIEITAGGVIALDSTAPGALSEIRTSDDVSLRARQITQGADARIEADSLSVATAQGAALGGANGVNVLGAVNTVSGNVDFNNTSALLTVTGIDQVKHGALSLNQSGDLRITGDVASGAQNISATGDMTIAAGNGNGVTVQANGAQTFNVGGSFGLLGGSAWNGYAQTLAKGPVRITTGDDLDVRGGGGLLAYALLYGGDGIRLTVGDELHVDRGRGLLAFARVQTSLWDRISLDFPNRASGGYFVDGREGASSRGLDGFFTGFLPARRGRGLIVSYGQ